MSKKDKHEGPSYRRQRDKKRDRAFVDLGGNRIYLGLWGTPESRARFSRVVAEWKSSGAQSTHGCEDLTVMEVCARFWDHAESYYKKPDGTAGSELRNYRLAIRPVNELYGDVPAKSFGPLALKVIRDRLITKGLTRKSLNRMVGRIKSVFRWAASEELVPASVVSALDTVEGLERGRSGAREAPPVRPVGQVAIGAVKDHVSPEVWGLIQLQLSTGARSGELVILRPCDLDMSGEVWTYSPAEHKTSWRGHERTIYLGPRSQEILKAFLPGCGLQEYAFSPRRAEARRREKMRAARKTPLSTGNAPGTNRVSKPTIAPGDRYTPISYARAVARACKRAGIDPWHPHQLRHTSATRIRKEFGIETASILLGHRHPDITAIYAEGDRGKAIAVAAKIG